MSNFTRTPRHLRRLRGIATLAGVGALATAAAVVPSDDSAPTPTSAPQTAAPSPERPVLPLPSSAIDEAMTSAPLSERVLIAASSDEVETAPAPEEAAAAAPAEPAPEPATRSVWDQLADCESGDWNADGGFVTASANWSSTAGLFEGGLQFHPDTWDGYRDDAMPGAAYDASRAQQIQVAERVLDAQGWQAWPVCSRKLGLR